MEQKRCPIYNFHNWLPERLFSKSTATFYSRLLLGITGIAEGESIFYNDVRPSLKLRSPNAYYSGFDARSQVGPHEADAGADGGRQEAERDVGPGQEAGAAHLGGPGDGPLRT